MVMDYLRTLFFIVLGIALLWLSYRILSGQYARVRRAMGGKPGKAGDPKTCLLCRARLAKGELMQTQAFPSLTGGKDKLMHIQGCVFCLGGKRNRICPVCSARLGTKDKLVARMFDRPFNRHHVHVIGCFQCRSEKRRPAAIAERFPKTYQLSPKGG
ncbi:MAG: hypothetical protein FWB79_01360 [Treponema sp.]|nr:hypothetical protein [Treponema sp.]